MFNDRYGLTQAVLDGRKTETRRVEPICKWVDGWVKLGYTRIEVVKNWKVRFHDDKTGTYVEEKTRYAIGEVVAVAQSYYDAFGMYPNSELSENGTFNKMFVRADVMPHRIRITDIRVERLQDISDEDCLREGIEKMPNGGGYKPYAFYDTYIKGKSKKEGVIYGGYRSYDTPREAFAALIDKVSGRGTWESNPYVVVYKFELVK